MQIHMILGLNGPDSIDALHANVQRVYPDRHLRLPGKPAWLVADDALARHISEKVGIDSGAGIAGLVTTIANYYGRANPDIWDWMKVMYERQQPIAGESALNAVALGAKPVREPTAAAS